MKQLLTALLVLVGLVGCSPRVIQYTNEGIHTNQLNTFLVLNFKSNDLQTSEEGQQILQTIKTAITQELENRNYKVSSKDPQLLVRFELISNQSVQEVARQPMNPYMFGYSSRFNSGFRSVVIRESILLVEINRASDNKLVWQASTELQQYIRKEGELKSLQDAVASLFNTYIYRIE